MAEFKFDRYKYNWRGSWAGATAYLKDDVVNFSGSSYVCIVAHTSNSNFYTDLLNQDLTNQVPAPRWVKMTDGYVWIGEWESTTSYKQGEIVTVNGIVYICILPHVSQSTFDPTDGNWSVYLESVKFRQNWQQNTRYELNDVVRYGGIVYKCIDAHTSADTSSGLEANSADWTVYYSNIEYRGAYQSSTRYRVNDLVKYKANILRCTTAYTSDLEFDENFWQIEFQGQLYAGEWDVNTYYSVGNIVKYGGYLYLSLTNHIGNDPSTSVFDFIQDSFGPHWEIISKGVNFAGTWNKDTSYKTGDVVKRGGDLYLALVDTAVSGDGSTLDYLDDSNWELITTAINFRGNWEVSLITDIEDPDVLVYAKNDIVKFIGNTYKALIQHIPSLDNSPVHPTNGSTYWELLLRSGNDVGLQFDGDLLSYGFNPYNLGIFDDQRPYGVEIGTDGQLLTVDLYDGPVTLPTPAPTAEEELRLDFTLSYKTWGTSARSRYVAINGVDDVTDPERGISPFKPWRTIKYAATQVDDGFTGNTTIFVAVGVYEETLPIIVPKGTVIQGSELRSTVIKPAAAVTNLANDTEYSLEGLRRLAEIVENVAIGNRITKTAGNSQTQILNTTRIDQVSFSPPQYNNQTGQEIFQTVEVTVVGTAEAGIRVQNRFEDIISYIDYHINDIGTEPAVTGSNSQTTDLQFVNTRLMLEANKEFLAEEAVAFVRFNYPAYNFNTESCKRDVKEYINFINKDLQFLGNYHSLLAARYYRNAVLGSEGEDMFYCRDATGVRDCTLSGLVGTKTNEPRIPEYQITNGPSYISLDPGWGPEHEACWITNRSPYIQGVTTLGFGCVGQKIDGALHNGGNRSIVSNDFTQVLSDGVGAWVANGGRAELVSVFTYYCNIGYWATNGGIIRATNGNNSYGTYGALADGRDNTEIPITGTLNNRTTEASIENAIFADDGSMVAIAYDNAGIFYSSASLSVVGAGANLSSVFEDFRDNALYDIKPIDINAGDDSALNPTIIEDIGGSGYTLVQGSAQPNAIPGNDIDEITLQSNDDNVEATYLGMRLILIAGPGAGQYGYISSFNTVSKVAKIRRESDDELGWDHLIPGTELAAFTNGTRYRIEPRVIISHPGYSSEEITLGASNTWGSVVYGETSGTFLNVPSQLGTGEVETQDGLVPVVATFDVVKNGRTYSVEINNDGAGYAVGDVLRLSGDSLDGVSEENDITIVVKAISDDSTNSITDFFVEGTASSGAFVLLPDGNTQTLYSYNGSDWFESEMPSSANWTLAAAGNNRFVSISSAAGSNTAAYSLDGVTWTATTMPYTSNWTGVAYGNGKFVAISNENNKAAYSTNGITWTAATLPGDDDSTVSQWASITYGKGYFVAVSNSGNTTARSTDGITWSRSYIEVDGSTQLDWKSVTYGKNRYMALTSAGEIAYSFDGDVWLQTDKLLNGVEEMDWQQIKYAQGVFVAICKTDEGSATTFIKTSENGVLWTDRTVASSLIRTSITFGNPDLSPDDSSLGTGTPFWITAGGTTNKINKITLGCRAQGRAVVVGGRLTKISIIDPGSAYETEPTITLISPNKSSDAELRIRINDGVLASPSWVNRGIGYLVTSTRFTITGNGVADVIPVGKNLTISNITKFPRLGSQILFDGSDTIYTIATATETIETDGSITGTFRITPELRTRNVYFHNHPIVIRERVSQIRLTGHDYLDVGTGNFVETNYPEIYSTGDYIGAPENEVGQFNGGVVFYTSTDQSGNFRVGELFQVEQATGIVTLSADFFDFSGLTEIRLGGIRLGGSGTVIREFSTDTLFSADSNSVVPTQRAIARYLQNRLTVGGSEIATSSFIAGTIFVGGTEIRNSAGLDIIIPVPARFDLDAQVYGTITAQTFFFASFREQPQL